MDHSPLHCFANPGPAHTAHQTHTLINHLQANQSLVHALTPKQQLALSRLVPLLLCGEQSAMHVFYKENERLNRERAEKSVKDLHAIEADEYIHEEALQSLTRQLPTPQDITSIKRRARIFYAQIQRYSEDLASHFRTISELDACVCLIMNELANSSIQGTPAARIFELIKKDEAKHVAIARKHANWLEQLQHNDYLIHQATGIQKKLILLLDTERYALEDLGINTASLYQRIHMLAEKRHKQEVPA